MNTMPDITGMEKAKRAREWGRAHGYKGDRGGWIRDSLGAARAQGWWEFYNRMWRFIEANRTEVSA